MSVPLGDFSEMETTFKPGMTIYYVPCGIRQGELGAISSIGEKYIFVRFYKTDGTLQDTAKACEVNSLVWRPK